MAPCRLVIRAAVAVALPAWMAAVQAAPEPARAPVVAGFERFGRATSTRPLDALDAGRLLIAELGCTACHRADAVALAPKSGPDLSGAGTRVDGAWLRRYLADPAAAAPGTTMPHVLAAVPPEDRAATIAALAAHLATRRALVPLPKPGGMNPMPPAFWERGDAAAGAVLYHRVGCVACHAAEKGRGGVVAGPATLLAEENLIEAGMPLPEKPFASVPLGHVAAKYTRRSLTEFLMVPLHARPSGRMPSLDLKAAEAADIAAYLQRTAGAAAPAAPVSDLPADDALVARGREAFVALGCAACHAGGVDGEAGGRATVAARAPPLTHVAADAPASCIPRGELAATGGPRYLLDEPQWVAVVAALDDLRRQAAADAPAAVARAAAPGDLDLTLLRLNCVACHERDGRGGVGTERRAFFETVDHVDLGDEGRLPPRLTGVGARLGKSWLKKAVAGGVVLRPFMRARMPLFPKESVAALPDQFRQADRATAAGGEPSAAVAFPPAGDTAALVPAGAALLDAGCIQCHPLGDRSLPGTVGVNLAGVTKRVDPAWFRRLLLDPMAVRPGTKMPAFFGATVNRTILDGDAERQVAALWAYLDRAVLEPLPARLAAAASDFELVPEERPLVIRTFMERAGTHAVAVGFPAGVHVAWDAERCRLAEAWHGRFLDARGTWVLAKSAPPADPLGTDRIVIDGEPAVAVSGADATAARVRFLGYVLDRGGVPTFRYRIDTADGAAEIADRFAPDGAAPPGGLVRRLTVRRAAGAPDLPRGLVFRPLAGTSLVVTADAAAGATARATDTPFTATLDHATAARAGLRDAAQAWVVPLDADDTTVEVRYRW
jgi:cytochrome c2